MATLAESEDHSEATKMRHVPVVLTALSMVFPAAVDAQSGSPVAETFLKSNTVKIIGPNRERPDESEFVSLGFIVGQEADKLYIVTPRHAVDRILKASVIFCADSLMPRRDAVLEYRSATDEVAILSVITPTFVKWQRVPTREPHLRKKVWAVGRQGACKNVSDNGYVSSKQGTSFGVEGLKVAPTSSGAPVVNRHELLGMLLNDNLLESEAISVTQIQKIVDDAKVPWGLDAQLSVFDWKAKTLSAATIAAGVMWLNRDRLINSINSELLSISNGAIYNPAFDDLYAKGLRVTKQRNAWRNTTVALASSTAIYYFWRHSVLQPTTGTPRRRPTRQQSAVHRSPSLTWQLLNGRAKGFSVSAYF